MEKRIELEKRGRNPGDVRHLSNLSHRVHSFVRSFALLLAYYYCPRVQFLSRVSRFPLPPTYRYVTLPPDAYIYLLAKLSLLFLVYSHALHVRRRQHRGAYRLAVFFFSFFTGA